MLHAPSKTDNFRIVAERLLDELEDDESEEARAWLGCENARFRSAVSRAYYAAMLDLKYRLVVHMRDVAFPSRGVHGHLQRAVRDGLKSGPRRSHGYIVANKLRDLSGWRNEADYDWASAFRIETVEEALDLADELRSDFGNLTPNELYTIARALMRNVSAEGR